MVLNSAKIGLNLVAILTLCGGMLATGCQNTPPPEPDPVPVPTQSVKLGETSDPVVNYLMAISQSEEVRLKDDKFYEHQNYRTRTLLMDESFSATHKSDTASTVGHSLSGPSGHVDQLHQEQLRQYQELATERERLASDVAHISPPPPCAALGKAYQQYLQAIAASAQTDAKDNQKWAVVGPKSDPKAYDKALAEARIQSDKDSKLVAQCVKQANAALEETRKPVKNLPPDLAKLRIGRTAGSIEGGAGIGGGGISD